MSKWAVMQWGDGSQDGKDLWNIAIPEHEAVLVSDMNEHTARHIAAAHNDDIAELEDRTKELEILLERGYSLVKPPPVQAGFQNVVEKARAAWLTDVLEVLTRETEDGN